MSKKELTLTSKFILALHMAEDMALPFISISDLKQRALYPESYDSFRSIYYRLQKRGLLKFINYKQNKFITLTGKGQLEALLAKAAIQKTLAWDGKWRLVMFDIPEEAKYQRQRLRELLRANGFIKLQASVFISPWALNREAVEFLKDSKLINYIRILRVDDIDDDKDLKKRFGLK